MFTSELLTEASERHRRLLAEAAAERLVRRPTARRALARTLRRTADRLDPAPLLVTRCTDKSTA